MRSACIQITMLGLLLSSSLPAQHAPVAEKNPLAGSASAAEAGKKTYINSCQLCHGGDGGGGRGPALATREFRHGGEDWQLFQTIRDGVPGTQMPGFAMGAEDLWQVVTYLRTLTPSGKEEAIQGDALAGEQVEVVNRKLALLEDTQHRFADRARGSNHRYVVFLAHLT